MHTLNGEGSGVKLKVVALTTASDTTFVTLHIPGRGHWPVMVHTASLPVAPRSTHPHSRPARVPAIDQGCLY